MPIAGGTREDAVLPRADGLVRRVDAGHVERRHRHREVHRVPEPEAALVGLAPRLGEERVVRVHLLPALAAVRRRDLVRARERAVSSAQAQPWRAVMICLSDARHPPADARRARGARARRRPAARSPAPTEVLVRVAAAGVNPVDWKTRDARRLPRRAAVHGRLGRRGRRRGGRPRRDPVRAGRPRLRHAALSPRGGGLRRVRHRRPRGSSPAPPTSSTTCEAAALPLAGLTAWQALVETAGVEEGHRLLDPRGRGRRRAPGGTDRKDARRVRDRDRARGQACVPGRDRHRRDDRLHDRVPSRIAPATSTSCSTSSATSRAPAALADAPRRRHLHLRPVGLAASTRCARPRPAGFASPASSSSPTAPGLEALAASSPRARSGRDRTDLPARGGRERARARRDRPHAGQARADALGGLSSRAHGPLRPRPRRLRRRLELGAGRRPARGAGHAVETFDLPGGG